MTYFLMALSALWLLIGGLVFAGSKSSVHEILAVVAMLTSAVLLGSACIVAAVNRLHKLVKQQASGGPIG